MKLTLLFLLTLPLASQLSIGASLPIVMEDGHYTSSESDYHLQINRDTSSGTDLKFDAYLGYSDNCTIGPFEITCDHFLQNETVCEGYFPGGVCPMSGGEFDMPPDNVVLEVVDTAGFRYGGKLYLKN